MRFSASESVFRHQERTFPEQLAMKPVIEFFPCGHATYRNDLQLLAHAVDYVADTQRSGDGYLLPCSPNSNPFHPSYRAFFNPFTVQDAPPSSLLPSKADYLFTNSVCPDTPCQENCYYDATIAVQYSKEDRDLLKNLQGELSQYHFQVVDLGYRVYSIQREVFESAEWLNIEELNSIRTIFRPAAHENAVSGEEKIPLPEFFQPNFRVAAGVRAIDTSDIEQLIERISNGFALHAPPYTVALMYMIASMKLDILAQELEKLVTFVAKLELLQVSFHELGLFADTDAGVGDSGHVHRELEMLVEREKSAKQVFRPSLRSWDDDTHALTRNSSPFLEHDRSKFLFSELFMIPQWNRPATFIEQELVSPMSTTTPSPGSVSTPSPCSDFQFTFTCHAGHEDHIVTFEELAERFRTLGNEHSTRHNGRRHVTYPSNDAMDVTGLFQQDLGAMPLTEDQDEANITAEIIRFYEELGECVDLVGQF